MWMMVVRRGTISVMVMVLMSVIVLVVVMSFVGKDGDGGCAVLLMVVWIVRCRS